MRVYYVIVFRGIVQVTDELNVVLVMNFYTGNSCYELLKISG